MELSYLLMEISVYVCFILVGIRAFRTSISHFLFFTIAILFGLFLEYYFVTQYEGYTYGKFLIMLGKVGSQVPLWVALGWGTIIFMSMRVTELSPVPKFAQPLMAGLLATSIDFSLDPVAQYLKFWDWSTGPRPGDYYGVPFDNFMGWLIIVSSLTSAYHLGNHLSLKINDETLREICSQYITPIVSGLAAFLSVVLMQFLLDFFYESVNSYLETGGEALVFFSSFGLAAGVVLGLSSYLPREVNVDDSSSSLFIHIAVFLHALCLMLMLACGIWITHPTLLVLMPTMAIASLTFFVKPDLLLYLNKEEV